MNFATYSAVGSAGTHFVTTSGQLPVTKLQQNVPNNGTMPQVVGMVGGVNMGDGVQYVRAIDGTSLQVTPQVLTVPISLPGCKPGDPQPTVQIQVLNPNIQQQQSKYQMQIPIQGFQNAYSGPLPGTNHIKLEPQTNWGVMPISTMQNTQFGDYRPGFFAPENMLQFSGGAVVTVAYSPEATETGGIQLVGNTLPEGLQVVTAMPHEMQLMHAQQTQDNKEQIQHQLFITHDNQIIFSGPDTKPLNNNTSANNNNNDVTNIVIKEECDDTNDDESSQGTEACDNSPWQLAASQQDLVRYLNGLPPQHTQTLPVSLQQFLRLNPNNVKKTETHLIAEMSNPGEEKKDVITEAVLDEDGTIRIQNKKKKKYKKKPPKPARPKPGQVLITTAIDGTPIFCCPECDMAYPEKGQLEVHLSVHKIERRFICGICGAGLKRKEHLERHKLGHNPERPYVCGACGKGFKRREHLNLHAVIHSGVKTELCGQCGKGFYRKDHLRKHTRSHETKRAKEEANFEAMDAKPSTTPPNITTSISTNSESIMPAITIHVPTSSNMAVPVQINIPQHVVSSLNAAQAAPAERDHDHDNDHDHGDDHGDAHAQLDALLAHHS